MSKQKSLQRELYKWIIITALVLVLLGGAIAGFSSFKQAKEFQDDTLKEISLLVRNGQLSYTEINNNVEQQRSRDNYKNYDEDEDAYEEDFEIEETTIVITETGKNTQFHDLVKDVKDGFQTMRLEDEEWRVLTITQDNTQRRFNIAQPTELRNEIAMSSALNTFFPLLALVIILLLVIHVIIRRQFRSLQLLANVIDKQDGSELKALSQKNIPLEITPFIYSINALIERLRQLIQKQQRFIADAAHELRTPIAALSLQAENLKKANTEIERKDRQQNLQKGFDRIAILLSQLLDLARLQSSVSDESQIVLFNDVVKNTIADLYPLAESAKIDLGMLRQQEAVKVIDQSGRLGQLIHNAISNAIHYTPALGKVDISLFTENGKAVFLVEDTGIGIPEAQLQQVIEPFYRVLESGKPGNGLGLAISHEISQRLKGKIRLTNRAGGGLCFRYEQPLAKDK